MHLSSSSTVYKQIGSSFGSVAPETSTGQVQPNAYDPQTLEQCNIIQIIYKYNVNYVILQQLLIKAFLYFQLLEAFTESDAGSWRSTTKCQV